MRTAPTATVNNPPATAANMMATPSGRLQCQPRNANSADSVFWAMKISRTISTRNPKISAPHMAAAFVNLTASSGGADFLTGFDVSDDVACGAGGGVSDGVSGDANGSLVMSSIFPFPSSDETTVRVALGSRKVPRNPTAGRTFA